tara:strand:- start:328 stop:2172 length:1845 start_codon:yes stop_codon:yes gene_type:complete
MARIGEAWLDKELDKPLARWYRERLESSQKKEEERLKRHKNYERYKEFEQWISPKKNQWVTNVEQGLLQSVADLPKLVGLEGVDRRISDPLTMMALSGSIRGISNVARSPKAMQGLKNINPLAPASQKVVKVKSTPIHGKPIPAETSASVLKKDSMFRKGSKSEVLAKEQSQINRALSGDPTANVFLSTQPYTLTTKRDYIAESGMDVEAALNWLRVEQPAHLKNLLTTGAGKKKVLNTIDQLEEQYAANKSVALKSKIDWYKSMVATGPAMSPSDTLLYGPNTKDFTGNTKALTAHLKGFVDNWESQRHQSTHGHHYHMKALQYSIYKRLFELKEQGIVTEGDILNTHAMLWPSGMTSGSRRSSIMSVDAVPHISTHKLELQTEGQFDTGPIEPTSTPFAAGPLIKYENGKRVKSSRPKDSSGKYIVDKDEWKLIQESGIEVNRFDVEYIKNWAGKNNNIEFGIQKLKKLKSNKKLYALIGPDSKSEIDRIREEIANANSATEIQAIQQSLAENITKPMTESMQRSQDYAEHIGGGELMKYTKDLPGFHKEAAKWNEEQLLFQERLKEKKERRLQNYEPGTPEYEYLEWIHEKEFQHIRWRTGGGIQSFGRIR